MLPTACRHVPPCACLLATGHALSIIYQTCACSDSRGKALLDRMAKISAPHWLCHMQRPYLALAAESTCRHAKHAQHGSAESWACSWCADAFGMLRTAHGLRDSGLLPKHTGLWAVENPLINSPARLKQKVMPGCLLQTLHDHVLCCTCSWDACIQAELVTSQLQCSSADGRALACKQAPPCMPEIACLAP